MRPSLIKIPPNSLALNSVYLLLSHHRVAKLSRVCKRRFTVTSQRRLDHLYSTDEGKSFPFHETQMKGNAGVAQSWALDHSIVEQLCNVRRCHCIGKATGESVTLFLKHLMDEIHLRVCLNVLRKRHIVGSGTRCSDTCRDRNIQDTQSEYANENRNRGFRHCHYH